QDDYFDARYTHPEDFRFQLDDAAAWAKETSGESIGVAGLSGAYNQYILYGDELSNRVQFIGRELPNGDFRSLASPAGEDSAAPQSGKCAEFIRAVNEGGYGYVVTTPELDLNDPASAKRAPEGGWLRRASGAEQILREGRVAVFRIDGELRPADCAGAGAGRDG
ncbi:MAG: hypothetical protein M3O25_11175, partial [Actinomycetota bacterium]|nr:hypothetical protein [Actinomycetota bacterium]